MGLIMPGIVIEIDLMGRIKPLAVPKCLYRSLSTQEKDKCGSAQLQPEASNLVAGSQRTPWWGAWEVWRWIKTELIQMMPYCLPVHF